MKNSCFKKALSLLLAALILLAALPVVSFAADDDPAPAAATPTDATPSDAPAEVYEAADYNDAVRYVRDRLLARETVIRVACPDPSFEATCQESIFAYDSKSPYTGDYLKNSLERTSERTLDIYPMTDGSYQFVVSYQDGCRPEEEAAVSAAVAAILAELSLDENSPYEKALAIYTWLCEHVRPLAPSEAQEVHHSAYAALVPDADGRRAAVCQGFSAAFYALALSAGLEARMILGSHADGNEQMTAHAWNIVQLDGLWYYLDAFAGAWYGKDAVSPGRENGMNAYFCKPLKDGYGGYAITYADAYTASEIADY
ncbi:MAG: transglutaminase domain-containing protein, partial [Clostridia bacterium]|nr:transglutaminase domain-containing protein [Clostridia bacterium]